MNEKFGTPEAPRDDCSRFSCCCLLSLYTIIRRIIVHLTMRSRTRREVDRQSGSSVSLSSTGDGETGVCSRYYFFLSFDGGMKRNFVHPPLGEEGERIRVCECVCV